MHVSIAFASNSLYIGDSRMVDLSPIKLYLMEECLYVQYKTYHSYRPRMRLW